MATAINGYHIYHVDQKGKLAKKLVHTDGRATCVIDSLNVVQGFLKEETVGFALSKLATEFGPSDPEAWFLQREGGTPKDKRDAAVRQFLEMLRIPVFPTIYISDRLKHLDTKGVSFRVEWKKSFSMPKQRLVLNGGVGRKPTRFRCSLAS